MPFVLSSYRIATSALETVAPLLLRRRASRGKENSSRMGERLGRAVKARPAGELVWIHGASVGECLAVLPLIDELLKTENRSVIVTSGTVTSAKLMAERLPPNAFHQFAPIDTPAAVARFLDHWRPDVGLFVDSEIWPNILTAAHVRKIPLGLINGRMSARSFSGWRYVPKTATAVLSLYDVCLAQDEGSAERLLALGARNVQIGGNLKADAPPLPADAHELAQLRQTIGTRPVFLAASTHAGEDETLLPASDALRREFPNLLTVIVPRHPVRGNDISMLCGTRTNVRRSAGGILADGIAIYIADTIGEMGTFYRLASFAFVGGSLIAHGGQNPLEPARLGCAVLAGPHTANFASAYEAIFAAQGGGLVATSREIAALGLRLLKYPAEAKRMGEAGARAAASLGGAVERTRIAVEALLASYARA